MFIKIQYPFILSIILQQVYLLVDLGYILFQIILMF
jgi:hypothetical protein